MIRRSVVAALAALALASGYPAATYADPSAVRAQRAEVARLESQLAAIDQRAGEATEAYNGARWRLGEAETRIDRNTRTLRTTRIRLRETREVLSSRIRSIYASPPPSVVEVLVGSGSITSAVDGVELLERVGRKDASVVRGVRADLGRLRELRVRLVEDRAEARRQVGEAERRRSQVLAILAERRRVLESARGELRQLIREEEERQRREAEQQRLRALEAQRAARAAVAARAASPAPAAAPSSPVTYAPPSGGGNAAVVGIAMRYLGVPYVWGGASPSGFDCSGLASYVYAQIGKSVPHYTGAIWAKFPKVAPGDLQPGDMVFFYPSLGHMGIYIGNGQFIHAPRTGDVVKISSLADRMGNYVGAVRP